MPSLRAGFAGRGHQERGGKALGGDVADSESEAAAGEGQEIVVIASDSARGAAVARVYECRHFGQVLREEAIRSAAGRPLAETSPIASPRRPPARARKS